MKDVKSKKPFLEAIQNGEQQIKITDTKFLMACLVAEKCDNDKENVKKFLSIVLSSKKGNYGSEPKAASSRLTIKTAVFQRFLSFMAHGIM